MNSLAKTLTTLVVDKACCNGNKRTLNLDLSAYAKLATLEMSRPELKNSWFVLDSAGAEDA